MPENDVLLGIEAISKSFGATQALQRVSFEIKPQQIVGLLGDNGAGKSTLIKIITGVFPPDSGKIYFEGAAVNFPSPREARGIGIETVYQGSPLVELLSISRNLFLGREKFKRRGPFRVMDQNTMKRESETVLKDIGIRVRSTDEAVSILSGGERQAISIGRCMYFGAKLLILDEPLNNLSLKESEVVLDHIRTVRNKGVSVIFISHNMHQISSVADRYIVIEEGKKIADVRKEDTSIEELISIVAEGKYLASQISE